MSHAAASGAKRPFAKTLMSALCRFCCERLFGVVNDKFLEALMRFTLGDVRDHIVSSKSIMDLPGSVENQRSREV
jgi:hypothetical protein